MRRELSALLLATAISGPAFAAAPTWVVSETSAGVTILHAGGARPATRGLHVEAGDIISTGANARAVIVRGDQYAVVAPGTRLEVAGSDGPGLVQFFEKAGNVVFSIKKSSTPHFGVQTPYLAAVVKGTTFSVTVEDTGAAVQVVEGAVEVATVDGGAKQMVTPGAIATVDANDLRRLVLQGATTKVIRSTTPETPPPRSPTPAAVATAHSEATGVAAAFAPVGGDAAPMTTAEAPTRAAYTESVAAMVEDNSQSIGKLSGGLVSADSAMRVAVATIAPTPADRAIQSAQLVSVAARVSAGDPNSAGDVTKASGPAAPGPGADTGKGADPAAPGPGADTGKGAGPAAAGPGFDTGKGAGPAETGPGSDTGKGAGPAATGTGADNGKGAGPAAPGPGSDNGKGAGPAATGPGSDDGKGEGAGPAATGPGSDNGKGAGPAATGPGADTGKGAGPAATGPGADTGKGAGPAATGPGPDNGKGAGPAAAGPGADTGKGAGPAAPGPGSDNGKGTGRAAPGSGSDNGRDADDGKGASGTGKGAGKRGGHS